MKGGTAMSTIPFIKKMGFVGSDGTPTDLYREFRNPKKSRVAMGRAFRKLYERLYEMNEYVHDATDDEVKGSITECTGAESDSTVVKYTLSNTVLSRLVAHITDAPRALTPYVVLDYPISKYPDD